MHLWCHLSKALLDYSINEAFFSFGWFFFQCAYIASLHISLHKEFTCVPISRSNLWICMKYDFIICLQFVWKNVAGKFRPRFMPKYQIRQDEICGKIAFETSVVCIYFTIEKIVTTSDYRIIIKKPNNQCYASIKYLNH